MKKCKKNWQHYCSYSIWFLIKSYKNWIMDKVEKSSQKRPRRARGAKNKRAASSKSRSRLHRAALTKHKEAGRDRRGVSASGSAIIAEPLSLLVAWCTCASSPSASEMGTTHTLLHCQPIYERATLTLSLIPLLSASRAFFSPTHRRVSISLLLLAVSISLGKLLIY